MENISIKINTNIHLSDAVSSIWKGEWKIPRFQREFVWEKKKVIELLDSMYKGFPIGAFFLWIPPEEYSQFYKDTPELKIESGNRNFYTHFILDGQQRLTSLYVVYRGLTIERFDYSNICFDLDSEKFNADQKDLERNIPLCITLNSDHKEHYVIYNRLTDDRKKRFNNLRDRLRTYPFPIVTIKDKNIEEASKIFERINQGGKRLSIFDLVVAITWDKDFELKKKIDEFNNKVKELFGKIDNEIFSETISLIANKQCTKAFQLKLTPNDVKDKWDKVENAIGKTIQFLRTNLKVKSYEYLPYRDFLPLIAYYFYEADQRNIGIDYKTLELWFWKASFSNRYSSSSFTKMGEDRAYIFDRMLDGEIININYDISLDLEKIKNVHMGRITALRNALILIMIQQQPLSFMNNNQIDLEKDFISEFNQSEKHHIFPKGFLRSQGIKEKKVTDLVVNFCLIDSELNKSISGTSPKEYFTQFREQNIDLKKAIISHLISADEDSGIWSNDYKSFIEQRAEILLRQVKNRIGDFTATIEEQMNSNPAMLIQKLEQNIRETINSNLYDGVGENWWDVENIVPQDIKDDAKNKIRKERANKPYIMEQEWENPLRKLEQINIPDYQKIILKNWSRFTDIFGSKNNVETHFNNFYNIRNQIDHIKTIDSTDRKIGESSIEWIFKCLQKNNEELVDEESQETSIGYLYVNEIYEELKKQIMTLDPDIKEEDKNGKKVYTKNSWIQFVRLYFRKDHILVRIFVRKGELHDPKSITQDKTDNNEKEIRQIYFEIKSRNDIEYAMELIKQAYHFNEGYLQKRIELKPRHYERHQFWSELLEIAKQRDTSFQNLSPSYSSWIGKGSGKSGISYVFVITKKHSYVQLYLDSGDKEINKKRFDFLFSRKDEIEKVFGKSLSWDRLDLKRACSIYYEFDWAGLGNKDKWQNLQNQMIENMIQLETATKEFINQLD